MKIHTNDSNNGSVEYVFHIPVPSGNNDVGVPWWECVKNCSDYPKTTKAFQQDDLEDIEAGKIVEIGGVHVFSRDGMSDAEKLDELEQRFKAVAPSVIMDLMMRFRVYGFEEDL